MEYLSEAGIQNHIEELVWSFRRIFLPDVSADLVSPADFVRFQRESQQAWWALSTAFGHERDFNREFLSNGSSEAFDRITKQLIQWTATIPWPRGDGTGKWIAFAKTPDECNEKTRPFTHDRLWPFTKIIRCVKMLDLVLFLVLYT